MTLFTIGYARHTPVSLVEALRAAGVERVVDVRERPWSRKPGFSKTALAASLGEAGIGYEHVRELGNPFRSGAEWKERYRDHVRALPALRDLAARLDATPTCLLCLEADPAECHRSLIVEALGVDAAHL